MFQCPDTETLSLRGVVSKAVVGLVFASMLIGRKWVCKWEYEWQDLT